MPWSWYSILCSVQLPDLFFILLKRDGRRAELAEPPKAAADRKDHCFFSSRNPMGSQYLLLLVVILPPSGLRRNRQVHWPSEGVARHKAMDRSWPEALQWGSYLKQSPRFKPIGWSWRCAQGMDGVMETEVATAFYLARSLVLAVTLGSMRSGPLATLGTKLISPPHYRLLRPGPKHMPYPFGGPAPLGICSLG